VPVPEPAASSLPITEERLESAPCPVETEIEPLALPTAEEIEQINEEARRNGFDEGFDEGLTQGREKGYAEGREEGFREGREAGFSEGRAAAENEARQLHELAAQLEQALAQLDAEIAEELLSLAVELARKIIQHTLAVEPESVVSAIRAVLQTLPQARAQIHLNPDDMALAHSYLKEVLEQAGHVLIEDETVSRGGCRVEMPGAQIDATMETRWRRAIESLGREHSAWVPASDRRTKTRRASDNAPTTIRRKASSAKGESAQAAPEPANAASSTPAVPVTPPEPAQ
jgi:flagellar assembly protein FliH